MTWAEILQEWIKNSPLKEVAKESLGPLYAPLKETFWALWSAVLPASDHRLYWLYILATLVIAFGIYLLSSWKNGTFSLRNFLEFCFPRSVYVHKSAIVDYKYYVINTIFNRFVHFSSLIVTSTLVAQYWQSVLQSAFGDPDTQWQATISSRLLFTAFALVAIDLGFFIGHYLEHKVRFFWEFHKVHHSAEVLTPVTAFRFHPIDKILEGFFMTALTGVVAGTFGYLFHNGIDLLTIINVSVLIFIYNLQANFRHSHIWISYGWRLSHILSSPAMHQIHHSPAKRHVDKNLGLIFSVWDYLVGTLYVPREKEDLQWGLTNEEHKAYDSVWTLYVLPVKKAARLVLADETRAR